MKADRRLMDGMWSKLQYRPVIHRTRLYDGIGLNTMVDVIAIAVCHTVFCALVVLFICAIHPGASQATRLYLCCAIRADA